MDLPLGDLCSTTAAPAWDTETRIEHNGFGGAWRCPTVYDTSLPRNGYRDSCFKIIKTVSSNVYVERFANRNAYACGMGNYLSKVKDSDIDPGRHSWSSGWQDLGSLKVRGWEQYNNKYYYDITTVCLKCPDGYKCAGCSGKQLSTTSDQCITGCNRGECSAVNDKCTEGAGGGAYCKACPLGEYNLEDKSGSCYPAPEGYCASNLNGSICVTSGATNITQCLEGTCASKNAAVSDNGKVTDSKCIGENNTGAAYCNRCAVGSYSDSKGSTECTEADIGYCASNGSECARGNDGAVSQKQCPAGTCSSRNGTTCNTIMFTSSNGRRSIRAVPGGSYCAKCSDGFYSGPGEGTCKKCEGVLQKEGGFNVGCTPCAEVSPGTTWNSDTGQCEQCGRGNYIEDNRCEPCPAGYACSDIYTKESCSGDSGEYSNEGQTECSRCAARTDGKIYGMAGVAEAQDCTACEDTDLQTSGAVMHYTDNGVCKECPGKPTGATWGRLDGNKEGIGSCSYYIESSGGCEKSYYKYKIDANTSIGAYSTDATTTRALPNHYVEVTSGVANGTTVECKPCPAGTYSEGGTGGIGQCHTCGAGSCFYTYGGEKYCKTCSAGYACPAGSDGKAQTCVVHPDNPNIKDYYGMSMCGVNTFSSAGKASCTSCAGNYTTVGSEKCINSEDGQGCKSADACMLKGSNLCRGGVNNFFENCSSWPACIIEGKVDKSNVKVTE